MKCKPCTSGESASAEVQLLVDGGYELRPKDCRELELRECFEVEQRGR
jgi:hypothetical protein